jgi:integrase
LARRPDRSELKLDRDGNRRTAHSLRHTYICMRLMEGADIYQIAKNCLTSVEMIEKFYAVHIKNRFDASAINVRRLKVTTRKQVSEVCGAPVDPDIKVPKSMVKARLFS